MEFSTNILTLLTSLLYSFSAVPALGLLRFKFHEFRVLVTDFDVLL
ncbi:MAG: hypothetical protein ACJAWV_001546 [Flammeovirgaceae bacterium]|jgi:hypothetical protein